MLDLDDRMILSSFMLFLYKTNMSLEITVRRKLCESNPC